MSRTERDCENTFSQMKQVYNANTPENHPIIFSTESDFKAAMSIFAVCARMFPHITIYAFQIMSNHVHMVVSGERSQIQDFFAYFRDRLRLHLNKEVALSSFELKLFLIEDLSYFRNSVAYVNRNGFVVLNDVTPFSYPWGSSSYFFQPMALQYSELAGKPIGNAAIRALMHSRQCDQLKGLKMIDGYISPLEFCDIETAENTFRDAKQYFYAISRNVESYSEIAKSIGESIFYTDTDLYNAAVRMAKDHFGRYDLRTLPVDAKMEIARRLHFDYNAGDKQLQRLLSMDAMVLKAMF